LRAQFRARDSGARKHLGKLMSTHSHAIETVEPVDPASITLTFANRGASIAFVEVGLPCLYSAMEERGDVDGAIVAETLAQRIEGQLDRDEEGRWLTDRLVFTVPAGWRSLVERAHQLVVDTDPSDEDEAVKASDLVIA
jgi:hypothetical protein